MKISIKDYTFYSSGNFKTFRNNTAVRAAIKAAGGETTSSLALSTTALVVGSGYMLSDAAAKARGLLMLDEEQLIALLRDGTLEVPDPAPVAEAPRDVQIGELRGVFAQPPSAAVWGVIVEAVDQCAPDQLDELVAYIEGHISRWEVPAEGELRRAPAHWISAMFKGEESVKFGLARSVVLAPHSMKNAEVIKLLGVTSLTQLTELDLGVGNKYAANMWKTLLSAPSTKRLERLTITSFKDEHVKALSGPHHLDHLTHVTINYYFSKFDASALDALAQARWMQQLTSITLRECGNYRREIEPLLAKLPALKHITIDADQFIGPLGQIMAWRLPVEEVRWASRLYMFASWDTEEIVALCGTAADGPATLDMRGLTISIDPALPEHDALHAQYADMFLQHLPGSALIRSLKAIQLGRWWSEALVAAITRPGLTITR